MENSITSLSTVKFSNLFNWSVQYLIESDFAFNEDYELVSLGSFLTRNKTVVNIQDDEQYTRVTVSSQNRGIKVRDVLEGKLIGTKKQYRIEANQFLMSKIDARNGAFGIVPKELDGAIVTNDFPSFIVDEKLINIEFLVLITTTKQFIDFAQSCSSGTTGRRRIDMTMFLAQKIPLPHIDEQNSIVSNYNQKLNNAELKKIESKKLAFEIEEYLIKSLGINKVLNRTKKSGLHFVQLSSIEKWGIDFIETESSKSTIYESSRIKELCSISSGGTPSRSRKDYYENGTIPWVKTGELENEVIFDTEEKITQSGLSNSSAKLYNEGAIIIAMYGATIGKTAKLGIKATTNQACAVLFNFNIEKIYPDYLWEYLQSQIENLKKLAYGSAQPNLNAGIIANYPVPLPDIDIQEEITKKIKVLKEKVKNLNSESLVIRESAQWEFEQKIFSDK